MRIDATRIDAGDFGQGDIVGDRPHLLAQPCVAQPRAGERDRGDPDQHDDELQATDAHGPDVDGAQRCRGRWSATWPPAKNWTEIAQHQRQADGDEEKLERAGAGAPHRLPDLPVERTASSAVTIMPSAAAGQKGTPRERDAQGRHRRRRSACRHGRN